MAYNFVLLPSRLIQDISSWEMGLNDDLSNVPDSDGVLGSN